MLVVTEHGYNNSNIDQFKIQNYQLANFYCRNSTKGGGVAIFTTLNSYTTPYKHIDPTDKDFEVTGVSVQTNTSQITVIGIYRSPSGDKDVFLSKFEQLLSNVTKKVTILL